LVCLPSIFSSVENKRLVDFVIDGESNIYDIAKMRRILSERNKSSIHYW